MTDYTHEIEKSISILKRGGLLLYPTDTVWGIGCDATNADAIEKIFVLKQRPEKKALLCLVSDFRMLNKFVEEVPEVAYDILNKAKRPTTIIYDKPIRIAENLVAEDNTLGIRITKNEFCQQLLRKFKKPLVSTSANISGEETPNSFSQISQEILKGVDYIVNLPELNYNSKPSAIIKLSNNGQVEVIRK